MASKRVVSEPNGTGRSGDKEIRDENPHVTPSEAPAATTVVPTAAPTVMPTHMQSTVETEGPTVETIEDITEHVHENTRAEMQPARLQASAPGNGEGSSSAPTRHHRDCIVSRTVHRHPPYLAEVPNALLGQVWIDHIVSPSYLFSKKHIC